jgi:hypothetical protein
MASKIMTRRRERSRRRLVKVRIVRSVALRWGGAAMVRGRQGREEVQNDSCQSFLDGKVEDTS